MPIHLFICVFSEADMKTHLKYHFGRLHSSEKGKLHWALREGVEAILKEASYGQMLKQCGNQNVNPSSVF